MFPPDTTRQQHICLLVATIIFGKYFSMGNSMEQSVFIDSVATTAAWAEVLDLSIVVVLQCPLVATKTRRKVGIPNCRALRWLMILADPNVNGRWIAILEICFQSKRERITEDQLCIQHGLRPASAQCYHASPSAIPFHPRLPCLFCMNER